MVVSWDLVLSFVSRLALPQTTQALSLMGGLLRRQRDLGLLPGWGFILHWHLPQATKKSRID